MATNIITTEFSNDILKAHNQYRAKHGAPNLKISDKLNKIAQEWSEQLATKDKAEHRPDNAYGENIYMAGSTDPNWKLMGDTAVKSWYDEIKFYKFGEPSPKNVSEVGHFTQLVWKDTLELGIGEAKNNKSGRVYVVCNYDPPGNVIPEFGKNVLPIKKSSKNENRNGQSIDEGYEEDREKIVLTPSQEKMGIEFVQPKIEIVESMERLYAVPSEKIRVWSVWLTKVEEKANEWNSWLRSHINLVLRLSEHLRRAEREIKKAESRGSMTSHDEQQYREVADGETKKGSLASDAGERFVKSSRGTRASSNQEPDRSQEERRDTMSGTNGTKETIDDETIASSAVGVESNGVEDMAEDSMRLENERTSKEENYEYTQDKNEDENDREAAVEVETSNGAEETTEASSFENETIKEENVVSENDERMNEEETEESKKIAWPIGVPWEPMVQPTMEESKVPKKKDEEVKVIAIPENEEDMQRLIRDVKEQATIFRSLYKHWLEVGDQAVKEVMHRTVKDSETVPTNEDIPYFFYVNAEPDIEIGVEHDDEKILLPDLTRERITSDFTPLYFNLEDKPGKG